MVPCSPLIAPLCVCKIDNDKNEKYDCQFYETDACENGTYDITDKDGGQKKNYKFVKCVSKPPKQAVDHYERVDYALCKEVRHFSIPAGKCLSSTELQLCENVCFLRAALGSKAQCKRYYDADCTDEIDPPTKPTTTAKKPTTTTTTKKHTTTTTTKKPTTTTTTKKPTTTTTTKKPTTTTTKKPTTTTITTTKKPTTTTTTTTKKKTTTTADDGCAAPVPTKPSHKAANRLSEDDDDELEMEPTFGAEGACPCKDDKPKFYVKCTFVK
ncbi:hypothetical protein BGZ68_005290 [Mortierella alpina]|nr:hypothetical protein BGZ68_005290 [Mortierella alpina]